MKKKKKLVQIDTKALRKLLRSLSHPSKTQKAQLRSTALVTAAVVLVISVFVTSPKLQSYFSSQPSEAGSLLLPSGVNPTGLSGTGGPVVNPSDAPWSPEGEEVTIIPPVSRDPQIHNNKVVYFTGNYGHEDTDIYMKDLNTNNITPICIALGNQISPVIYDKNIAWVDERKMSPLGINIRMYNLDTQKETQVTYNEYASSLNVAIYGDKLVFDMWYWPNYWGDSKNKELRMYDISTGFSSTLVNFPADYDINGLSIEGDNIVWGGIRLSVSGEKIRQIYRYNLSTDEVSLVSPYYYSQVEPDVYGEWIVWEDWRKGYPNIYAYNLFTKTTYVITNNNIANKAANYAPRIYRDIVIWCRWISSCSGGICQSTYNVYMHRMSDPIGKNHPVGNDMADYVPVFGMDVFANKFVWNKGEWPETSISLFELMN